MTPVFTHTWENGNIVNGRNGNIYTYGNVENKMNIDPITLGFNGIGILFKGLLSKNLPTGIHNYTYAYTLDNDGYPTQIKAIRDHDNSVFATLTITYY